jgi:hypothetical protein
MEMRRLTEALIDAPDDSAVNNKTQEKTCRAAFWQTCPHLYKQSY